MTVWESVERYKKQYERNNDEESLIENLTSLISKETPFSACAISAVKSLLPENIQNQLDLDL